MSLTNQLMFSLENSESDFQQFIDSVQQIGDSQLIEYITRYTRLLTNSTNPNTTRILNRLLLIGESSRATTFYELYCTRIVFECSFPEDFFSFDQNHVLKNILLYDVRRQNRADVSAVLRTSCGILLQSMEPFSDSEHKELLLCHSLIGSLGNRNVPLSLLKWIHGLDKNYNSISHFSQSILSYEMRRLTLRRAIQIAAQRLVIEKELVSMLSKGKSKVTLPDRNVLLESDGRFAFAISLIPDDKLNSVNNDLLKEAGYLSALDHFHTYHKNKRDKRINNEIKDQLNKIQIKKEQDFEETKKKVMGESNCDDEEGEKDAMGATKPFAAVAKSEQSEEEDEEKEEKEEMGAATKTLAAAAESEEPEEDVHKRGEKEEMGATKNLSAAAESEKPEEEDQTGGMNTLAAVASAICTNLDEQDKREDPILIEQKDLEEKSERKDLEEKSVSSKTIDPGEVNAFNANVDKGNTSQREGSDRVPMTVEINVDKEQLDFPNGGTSACEKYSLDDKAKTKVAENLSDHHSPADPPKGDDASNDGNDKPESLGGDDSKDSNDNPESSKSTDLDDESKQSDQGRDPELPAPPNSPQPNNLGNNSAPGHPSSPQNKKSSELPVVSPSPTKKTGVTTRLSAAIPGGSREYRVLSSEEYVKINLKFAQELETSKLVDWSDNNNFSNQAIIQSKVIELNGSNHCLVIKADGLFSSQMKNELIEKMSRLHFVKGIKGRQNSYVRVVVRRDKKSTQSLTCPFLIGNVLYPSQPATAFEIKLMNLMEEIMKSEKHFQHNINPFRVNLLQCMISSGNDCYGSHNDTSPLLNAVVDDVWEEERNQFETYDDVWLPSPRTQQTVTFVFCEGDDMNTHQLIWSKDGKKQEDVCMLTTGSNTVHIQTQGSQSGLKHRVEFNKKTGCSAPKWRLVISGRLTGNLEGLNNPSAYLNHRLCGLGKIDQSLSASHYNYTRVFDIFNSLGTKKRKIPSDPGFGDSSEEEDLAIKPVGSHVEDEEVVDERHVNIDLSNPFFSDTYKQLSYEDYQGYNIKRTDPSIRLGTKCWEVLSSGSAAHNLVIKHSFKLQCEFNEVVGKENNGDEIIVNHVISTLYSKDKNEFFEPLEAVNLRMIADNCGLHWNTRSKPMIRTDRKHHLANVIILTKPYKNDSDQLNQEIEKLLEGKDNNWMAGSKRKELKSLDVFGSGGSPSDSLAFPPDLKQLSRFTPNHTSSQHQILDNPINNIMMKLCERQGVVAIFLETRNFGVKGIMYENDSQDGIFLGYYYFDRMILENEDSGDIKRSNKRSKEEMHYCFREQQCYRFCLKPLFQMQDLFILSMKPKMLWRVGTLGSKVHHELVLRCAREGKENEFNIPFQSYKVLEEMMLNSCMWTGLMDSISQSKRLEVSSKTPLISVDAFSKTDEHSIEKLDPNDIVRVTCFLFYACATRYLRLTLKRSSNGMIYSTPINEEEGNFLGSCLRAHSFPSPFRSYDCIPLLLRGCAIDLGFLDHDQVHRVEATALPNQLQIMSEFLIMSILLRLTGRVCRFALFYKKHSTSLTTWIPKNDIEFYQFEKFLQKTTLRGWISSQHRMSIPSQIIANETSLCRFMKMLFSGLTSTVREMLTHKDWNTSAAMLEQLLSVSYERAFGVSCAEESFNFLVGEIICDISEVFADPFGLIKKGSWKYLCGSGSRKAKLMFSETLSSLNMEESLETLLALFEKSVLEETSAEEKRIVLASLGLEQKENAGKTLLSIKLNGREVNLKDMEHIMCKVMLLRCKTLGSNACSKQPISSLPHTHPLKLESVNWDDKHVKKIFDECREACIQLQSMGWSLPSFFQLIGEEEDIE